MEFIPFLKASWNEFYVPHMYYMEERWDYFICLDLNWSSEETSMCHWVTSLKKNDLSLIKSRSLNVNGGEVLSKSTLESIIISENVILWVWMFLWESAHDSSYLYQRPWWRSDLAATHGFIYLKGALITTKSLFT